MVSSSSLPYQKRLTTLSSNYEHQEMQSSLVVENSIGHTTQGSAILLPHMFHLQMNRASS